MEITYDGKSETYTMVPYTFVYTRVLRRKLKFITHGTHKTFQRIKANELITSAIFC